MRVFMTGASGLVGRALCARLVARGDKVVGLSRSGHVPAGVEAVTGDPTHPGEWRAKVAGCDAVIHLAGEGVADGRLGEEHRARVMHSREAGTREVVGAIAAAAVGQRPRVLVSASGTDYYPFDDSETAYDEHARSGDSFLAQVCQVWEREARAAHVAVGTRVALLRTGIVLDTHGGALGKLLPVFRLGMGGPIAGGHQWFPWVTIDDTTGAYLHALDRDSVSGPLNVVAPGIVRQREFARDLGHALGRPARLPTPGFALKLAVGGLAPYLLNGRKVVPSALVASGYAFTAPSLPAALSTLLAS